MDKKEINPKLKKELQHLQDVPERGLQASHTGRENFLTQIRTLKPRPVQANKPVQKGRRRSWALRMASVIAVLALALGSIGGTVYAAQASGPNDLLYSVKTLSEDIQVGLESDPQDRLDLFTQFASRRLTEIQAQIDAGEEVSEKALGASPEKWGNVRKVIMKNILFDGKLPKFLGFDRGPITIIGNLATPHQGQIFKSAGRLTTFAPSLRMVTDMSTDDLYSNLAGGPSDRRFSKWYASDLDNWSSGKYKQMTATAEKAYEF